jgi:hypothetical protein
MKMRSFFLSKLVFSLFLSSPCLLLAQNKPATDTAGNGARVVTQKPSNGPKPYKEVITAKAKTDAGLFKVHKLEDRYFFEIPDSLLGRDILMVSRISKAAAEEKVFGLGYAGDKIGERVIRFEKGPNYKLFIKNISFGEMSNDSSANGMYRSVLNSNLQPIMAAFDIKAFAKDSASGTGATVIDVTDFVNGDNDVLFFNNQMKRLFSLGSLLPDRSYTDTIRSYPGNIEIQTIKTYARGAGLVPGGAVPSRPATYELNTSMVLLPKTPMKPRNFDARVGYFASGYVDFDANPQGVKNVSMITRWKLEPKDADIEKYKRGELVEPKKQIVYYIDPATPKKWVPYLIAGVNDWNVAFEKAGWKNAIVAKEAPTNDPSWSIDDAEHSAIVYKPSDIANASGPHVHDPRSGEIIETHINWYHNVMELLQKWYLIQAAVNDPRARTMKFSDELMGDLIRFVSSHEVGHTLGLRHNFGSSSTVPVENLRNKAWVEANGHTPSIMDYARFNYVAQPEDNISPQGLYPRIGDYDKWAIEWGYRWFPDFKTTQEEETFFNKWIIDKTSKNKRLWFGTETDRDDPRCQNEDLGDNAMLAGAYGIKNLKRIMPNLLEWTKVDNEGYTSTDEIYNELVGQYNRYMGHVLKNIAGVMSTPHSVEESASVYEFVPKARQKEAMQFLQQQLFSTPKWLLDEKLFKVTGNVDLTTITKLQASALTRLFDGNTLKKLLQFEAIEGAKAYTATEMLSDLKKGIWSELAARQPIDMFRRNLQKVYTEKLISSIKPPAAGANNPFGPAPMNPVSDASSLIKGQMRNLINEIKVALPVMKDNDTRLHLQDISERLTLALDPNK